MHSEGPAGKLFQPGFQLGSTTDKLQGQGRYFFPHPTLMHPGLGPEEPVTLLLQLSYHRFRSSEDSNLHGGHFCKLQTPPLVCDTYRSGQPGTPKQAHWTSRPRQPTRGISLGQPSGPATMLQGHLTDPLTRARSDHSPLG